jgi:hypothetical protein
LVDFLLASYDITMQKNCVRKGSTRYCNDTATHSTVPHGEEEDPLPIHQQSSHSAVDLKAPDLSGCARFLPTCHSLRSALNQMKQEKRKKARKQREAKIGAF